MLIAMWQMTRKKATTKRVLMRLFLASSNLALCASSLPMLDTIRVLMIHRILP